MSSVDDEFEEAIKNIVDSPWLEAVATRITNEYNNPVGYIPIRPSKKDMESFKLADMDAMAFGTGLVKQEYKDGVVVYTHVPLDEMVETLNNVTES